MAIRKDIQITVDDINKKSVTDKKVWIYQGDKNLDIYFTITDNRFEYSTITPQQYSFSIKKPDGDLMTPTEKTPLVDGKVKFTITETMADELSEVGEYFILIHLYDDLDSRISIPQVSFEVVQPLINTNAIVNSGFVQSIILDDINDKLTRLDSNGNYIKTVWEKGDIVTKEKMNKIENQLVDLDKNRADVKEQLTEKATKGEITSNDLSIASDSDKIKLINLSEEVQEAMSGTAPVISSVQDNTITREKYAPKSITYPKLEFINDKSSKNIFDKETILSGCYLGSDGTLITGNYFTTDFIEANVGDEIKYSYDVNMGTNHLVHIYDLNKAHLTGNVLGVLDTNNVYRTVNLTVQGTCYIRISYKNSSLNTVMITKNNDFPLTYTPFSKLILLSEYFGLNERQKTEIVKDNSPLYNKIGAFNGDSIMYGAGYVGGFAKIIADKNNMVYENIAVSGATITKGTLNADGVTPRHYISQTIQNMRSDADFIILEGGVNDASLEIAMGTVTVGYTATLDETTFCGAFESMLKQAILRFPGKKIGFIIPHRMNGQYEPYYNQTIGMLEKWGIPYCDLFKSVPTLRYIDELKNSYTLNGDGWHPNETGYRLFYCDKIEAWMKAL